MSLLKKKKKPADIVIYDDGAKSAPKPELNLRTSTLHSKSPHASPLPSPSYNNDSASWGRPSLSSAGRPVSPFLRSKIHIEPCMCLACRQVVVTVLHNWLCSLRRAHVKHLGTRAHMCSSRLRAYLCTNPFIFHECIYWKHAIFPTSRYVSLTSHLDQTWRACSVRMLPINEPFSVLFVTEARKQTADRTASALVAPVSSAPGDMNERLGHTLSEPVASASSKQGVPASLYEQYLQYFALQQPQLLLRSNEGEVWLPLIWARVNMRSTLESHEDRSRLCHEK